MRGLVAGERGAGGEEDDVMVVCTGCTMDGSSLSMHVAVAVDVCVSLFCLRLPVPLELDASDEDEEGRGLNGGGVALLPLVDANTSLDSASASFMPPTVVACVLLACPFGCWGSTAPARAEDEDEDEDASSAIRAIESDPIVSFLLPCVAVTVLLLLLLLLFVDVVVVAVVL